MISLFTWAGNGLQTTDVNSQHNNQPFTTYDRDNDNVGYNCAGSYGGGWWYSHCGSALLTGTYTGHYAWYGDNGWIFLKESVMMVRRRQWITGDNFRYNGIDVRLEWGILLRPPSIWIGIIFTSKIGYLSTRIVHVYKLVKQVCFFSKVSLWIRELGIFFTPGLYMNGIGASNFSRTSVPKLWYFNTPPPTAQYVLFHCNCALVAIMNLQVCE